MAGGLDPVAFLRHFATYGPITGATVFPFELASVLLLAITTYSTVTSHWPGRLLWALAISGMVGTLVLLIYFVPTNLGMLDPAFPPQAVPAELTTWYRWNWVRAGLGVASAVLACVALTSAAAARMAPRRRGGRDGERCTPQPADDRAAARRRDHAHPAPRSGSAAAAATGQAVPPAMSPADHVA